MYGQQRMHEEITAPIWDGTPPSLEPRRAARPEEITTGMRPRPLADTATLDPIETSFLPRWLDDALRDPVIVVAMAALLGLCATGLAGAMGFLLGLIVG